MLETTAQIIIKRTDTIDGISLFEYEWTGPKDGVVGILFDYLKYLDKLPWKLEEVERDNILEIAYFKRIEKEE